MKGSNLDVTSNEGPDRRSQTAQPRRFVGVRFACCDVYIRVYVNRGETAYVGCGPMCARPVRIRIGPGGTDCRFFTAY